MPENLPTFPDPHTLVSATGGNEVSTHRPGNRFDLVFVTFEGRDALKLSIPATPDATGGVKTGASEVITTRRPRYRSTERERERNVLFNDALNTFYLRLYGVRHMVKDHSDSERERERNVLFNDALNTFYLRLYGVRHMVKDHSDSEREREMFYLTTHSTHFIYGYMASDIWLRTILIVRERNVLFNDALNTFYLRLYGVRHMVKDHSDSERERNVLFNDALNTFYLQLYGVRHMVKDHSDRERKPAAATWATLID